MKTIHQLQQISSEQQQVIHSYAETISMMTAECFTTKWQEFTKKFPSYTHGQIELCNIIIEWANQFEFDNSGREWDGEFYEEIDNFIKNKLS